MLLRDNELARRQEGRTELRPRPLRVRWNLEGLPAADGYEMRATFQCSVRALPDSTERRMLEEVLLGSRYALSDEDIARHFQPALHAAAAKAIQKHAVPEWLDGSLANETIELLREAASRVAFDCGLELLPPFNLDLQSPMYQQQQLRSMQQALVEKQTVGQIEHVQRSAALLKQFEEIRKATPQLSPGRMLEQISPADRGAMLQALLMASADSATALWAVAGPYLVGVATVDGSSSPRLHPLPPTLGPLRSVQTAMIEGGRRLLVGARSGFMVVDPQNSTDVQLFHHNVGESPLGFNRVIYQDASRTFVASHRSAGIVCWQRGTSDAPQACFPPDRLGPRSASSESSSDHMQTQGPRNLEGLDGSRFIFSVGATLFVTDLQDVQALATPSTSQIVAIVPDDRRVIAIHEDGTVCSVDRESRQLACLVQRSTRVRSAGSLPWLGSMRLLLADDQGPVECIGFDDQLVSQYQSPHRGLRAVTGSRELVAGISSDRQRLVLWRSWDGRQPLTEIYLTGLTRHRIADIDFC